MSGPLTFQEKRRLDSRIIRKVYCQRELRGGGGMAVEGGSGKRKNGLGHESEAGRDRSEKSYIETRTGKKEHLYATHLV